MRGSTAWNGRHHRRTSSRAPRATAAAAVAALALTACGSTADTGAGGTGGTGKVGVILPLLTSPFWQSYNDYVPRMAKSEGVDALRTVNSGSDPAQQITDIGNQLNQGVRGLVVAPLDSAAIEAGLKQAARKGVPVVAVDVAPDRGEVAMVVRADNAAYGEKACAYLGEHVGSGEVVQIMGDLASVNGRDRSEAFRACVKKDFPELKVLEIPAKWESDTAAAKLDTLLNAHPGIKGIYLQAGGVYLAPTLQTLKSKGLLKKAGTAGHIAIVSNDGIPQEFDAIRRGEVDATVSQPADAYARYGLHYVKAAMEGRTFRPGPTDHHSTIVRLPGGILEDQLPAPLVTRDNVDDPALWGNTVG
ncbi:MULTISPECIES: sugar ABC transporter substrate-binding protein [Streptomyces]|uniref:Sugar ABC transporter substrate-binding protein n=1 Tax=Streptomyces doudnae TaxID=3075536 RepID=A0ABD5EFU3_9ACTN|nr:MULTISPECIES: sugar ABC transporter substrate-binding protein [unclassified Streptomyces]MDT0433480.1 sugar ABC transporter substrate-binding protein [Streptomyces sp. DSM 41981]MYQ65471.1 substrate-binding domain-containing protein [Streptomyces sp. SID4950]SCE00733.1 monosaccharide ABC transporter substrate-binding protein, CUT2 family [Streptomyces sp. SolWspMP-5a-2]